MLSSNYQPSSSAAPVPRVQGYQAKQPNRKAGPLRQFVLLTQLDLLPAMLMPALWAAVLVWWQTGKLDPGILLLSLTVQSSLFMCLTALVHFYDHRRSRQVEIVPALDTIPTGFQLLVNGFVRPGTVHSLGLLFFTIGLAATLWLTYLAGWPLLFFGWLGLLLTYTFATPPVNYGYRGWGLDQVGILLAFGLLPAISTYYAQTASLTWLLAGSAIPLSLLATVTFASHGFLHWRLDWRLRKLTSMVMLGPQRALDITALLVVLAFVAIILLVGLGRLPVITLLGLAALPLILSAVAHVQRQEPNVTSYHALVDSTANATVLLGILLTAALWLDRLL